MRSASGGAIANGTDPGGDLEIRGDAWSRRDRETTALAQGLPWPCWRRYRSQQSQCSACFIVGP